LHCSKLGLKALWKKRTVEHQREYQREYRRPKNGGDRPPTNPARLRDDKCLKCGGTINLQAAHVKPLWAGGKHKHIITLCQKHHYKFDNLLRDFWKEGVVLVETEVVKRTIDSKEPIKFDVDLSARDISFDTVVWYKSP